MINTFSKIVQKAVSRIMLSVDNATDNIAFGFKFNFEPKCLKCLITVFVQLLCIVNYRLYTFLHHQQKEVSEQI